MSMRSTSLVISRNHRLQHHQLLLASSDGNNTKQRKGERRRALITDVLVFVLVFVGVQLVLPASMKFQRAASSSSSLEELFLTILQEDETTTSSSSSSWVVRNSSTTSDAHYSATSLEQDKELPTDFIRSIDRQKVTLEEFDQCIYTFGKSSSSSSSSSFFHRKGHYPYAYAMLITGVNPSDPTTYRGMLYNLMISAMVLRCAGSQADVVGMFRMRKQMTNETELPATERAWLEQLGIIAHYMPPTDMTHDSFYEMQLEKFRVLQLTQYRRVIMMDADIVPLGSMDYIFELSDNDYDGTTMKKANDTTRPILHPQVVVAGDAEPSNGGFFMVHPQEGEYEAIQEIVRKRNEYARTVTERTNNPERFDYHLGWGHPIEPPHDYWFGTNRNERNRTGWSFLFAYADPGLLYYYVKYHKKAMSTIMMKNIQNTIVHEDQDGTIRLEVEYVPRPFDAHTNVMVFDPKACKKWFCDFHHFSGQGKPWHEPKQGENEHIGNFTMTRSWGRGGRSNHFWISILHHLSRHLDGLNIDFRQDFPIGSRRQRGWAKQQQVADHINHANSKQQQQQQ